MSNPKGKYKEGIGGKIIHYVERLMNIVITLLNEHPVDVGSWDDIGKTLLL